MNGAVREEAQQAVRVYMSRTGLSLREIGARAGFAGRTLAQFVSGARFGSPETSGEVTGRQLLDFFKQHPAPLPEPPRGTFYATEATREMDSMLAYIAEGGWGILYGPAGGQKTFLLKFRAAEAAREREPWLVLVEADPTMTPRELLARIAQGLGAPYAWATGALRRSILDTLRARKTSVAVVIDDNGAKPLSVLVLETLRRLADVAGERMGVLVSGNEQVFQLFRSRRGNYMEQWRSRIEQKEVRVLGPSPAEARRILAGEAPWLKELAAEAIIKGATVKDPVSERNYVSARRLFNTIRDLRRQRGSRVN